MKDRLTSDLVAFVTMAREHPVQTGILTFSLPLFALFQVFNSVFHGGSTAFVGGYAVLVGACSLVLTQYQIAVFRRKRLTRQWR